MLKNGRAKIEDIQPGFSAQVRCRCGKSNKYYVISTKPKNSGLPGRTVYVRAEAPGNHPPLHFTDQKGTLYVIGDPCCEESWLEHAEFKSAKTEHWINTSKFEEYYQQAVDWYKNQPAGIYKLKIPNKFISVAERAGVLSSKTKDRTYSNKPNSLLYIYCSKTK